jgi:hypothetical protein
MKRLLVPVLLVSLASAAQAEIQPPIDIEGMKDVGAGIWHMGQGFETIGTGIWMVGVGVLLMGVGSIIRALRRQPKPVSAE